MIPKFTLDRSLITTFCKFRLPRADRGALKTDQVPGVGTYEDRSRLIKKSSPKYKIRESLESELHRSLRKDQKPSPASYNPFSTSISNIRYTMQSRNDKDEIFQRNLTQKMRNSLNLARTRPGPGEYLLRSSIESHTNSIHSGNGSLVLGKQITYRL